MPKFRSKPHEIEAFQFRINSNVKVPEWFIKAVEVNEIQVTMHEKHGYYVTIYSYDETGKVTQMEKAHLNDYICRADHGKIYKLDRKSFVDSYERI